MIQCDEIYGGLMTDAEPKIYLLTPPLESQKIVWADSEDAAKQAEVPLLKAKHDIDPVSTETTPNYESCKEITSETTGLCVSNGIAHFKYEDRQFDLKKDTVKSLGKSDD